MQAELLYFAMVKSMKDSVKVKRRGLLGSMREMPDHNLSVSQCFGTHFTVFCDVYTGLAGPSRHLQSASMHADKGALTFQTAADADAAFGSRGCSCSGNSAVRSLASSYGSTRRMTRIRLRL